MGYNTEREEAVFFCILKIKPAISKLTNLLFKHSLLGFVLMNVCMTTGFKGYIRLRSSCAALNMTLSLHLAEDRKWFASFIWGQLIPHHDQSHFPYRAARDELTT